MTPSTCVSSVIPAVQSIADILRLRGDDGQHTPTLRADVAGLAGSDDGWPAAVAIAAPLCVIFGFCGFILSLLFNSDLLQALRNFLFSPCI